MSLRTFGTLLAVGLGIDFVVRHLLGWPLWLSLLLCAAAGWFMPDRWFGIDKASVDRRREQHSTAVIGALYLGARYPTDIWQLAGGPSWRTYVTLARLEQEGRVESLPDGDRRAYYLTASGRTVTR